MSRITVRLPDTLHEQIKNLADQENVSLNQYIVYALTRQATMDYTVQAVPDKLIYEQRSAYSLLLQSLGEASYEQIKALLDEREAQEPESGLTPDIIEALRGRLP